MKENDNKLKRVLRESILPNIKNWFTTRLLVCHQGWLWAGLGLWLGADLLQNLGAMFFGVIPYIGQMLIDTLLDPIMTFVLGPLPIACGLELLRRWSIFVPVDDNNKNDAR